MRASKVEDDYLRPYRQDPQSTTMFANDGALAQASQRISVSRSSVPESPQYFALHCSRAAAAKL